MGAESQIIESAINFFIDSSTSMNGNESEAGTRMPYIPNVSK